MKSERMARVDGMIHRELAEALERLVRPEVECLLTITRVKTAPDLRQAQVFVSLLGGDEEVQWAAVLKVLLKHRKELQAGVAHRVALKFTPVLTFIQDRGLAQADRVLSLMNELGLPDPNVSAGPGPQAPPKPDDDKKVGA